MVLKTPLKAEVLTEVPVPGNYTRNTNSAYKNLAWCFLKGGKEMKNPFVVFAFVFIMISLSQSVFHTLGITSYNGILNISLPKDLALSIVIISVPIGILAIMYGIYSSVKWFAKTWNKSGG